MDDEESTTSKDDELKELYKDTVKICSRRPHTIPQIYGMIDETEAMTNDVLGVVPTSKGRTIDLEITNRERYNQLILHGIYCPTHKVKHRVVPVYTEDKALITVYNTPAKSTKLKKIEDLIEQHGYTITCSHHMDFRPGLKSGIRKYLTSFTPYRTPVRLPAMVELYGKKIGFEQTLSSVIVDRDVTPTEHLKVTVPSTETQPRHVEVTIVKDVVEKPKETMKEQLAKSSAVLDNFLKNKEVPETEVTEVTETTTYPEKHNNLVTECTIPTPPPGLFDTPAEEISDTGCSASRDMEAHFAGLSQALQKIKQPTAAEVKKINPEVDATQIISEIFGDDKGESSEDEVEGEMETEESEQLPDGNAGSPAGSPPPVRPALHKVNDGGFTKVKSKAQRRKEKKNLLKHQE